MADRAYGYAGKILVLNLEDESYETVDTDPYVGEWVGGHGLASRLFWEYCEDKTVDALDDRNVIVIASNPFAGTIVPAGGGRVEVTGLGPFSYPEWYSRSSVGGRLGGTMKNAGFDAVVVRGTAPRHVWVNVVNGDVTYCDAEDLWGKDSWETQEAIWDRVTNNTPLGEWFDLPGNRESGRSTSRPAVFAIGQAGENLVRSATITHDASHVSGQSGFGAVFGAKNLKALSFMGTKSIDIADPARLVELRLEIQEKLGYKVDDPVNEAPVPQAVPLYSSLLHNPGGGTVGQTVGRPDGCQGCYRNCRAIYRDRMGNQSTCNAAAYYTASGKREDQKKCNSLLNQLGLDGYETDMPVYLYNLYKMGVMGKGKEIDTDLPFENYNKYQFIDTLLHRIANREEIGEDLAEGLVRATMKWGRWDEDSKGLLRRPNWGYPEHYDPRLEVEWSYGSIFTERDINEHGINWCVHHSALVPMMFGQEPFLPADKLVEQVAKGTGLEDPLCFDYSEKGIYSDEKVRAVSWHRHYGRFWIQSMGLCDWMWPSLVNFTNMTDTDYAGVSPAFEVELFKAVTGRDDFTYEKSLELGHKQLLLDRAIWVLQGREPETEQLADYVFELPTDTPYQLPVYENGTWSYSDCLGRTLDRAKFKDVQQRFYASEGWSERGYPKREVLEQFGLADVADVLAAAGKGA